MKIAIIHAKYVRPEGLHGAARENALAQIRANLDLNYGMVEQAGAAGADLLITNECFAYVGQGLGVDDQALFAELVAETEAVIDRDMRAYAARYGMMIAANECATHEGKIYNTTTLYDRDGGVIGRFRKVHLPIGERFKVSAGTEFPVFETDLGRIGFAICYDIVFPEHCRILGLNGADIIVHQTQGWGGGGSGGSRDTGEAVLRTRAAENSVYLFVAKNIQGEGGMSCVIDNCGSVIASQPGTDDALLLAEFEPDYERKDLYYHNNYFSGVGNDRTRLLLEREPALYGRLTEDVQLSYNPRGERLCTREEFAERVRAIGRMAPEERKKLHWGGYWRDKQGT